MILQLGPQNTPSTPSTEGDLTQFIDGVGKFILAHSEKPYLVAALVVVGVIWFIWRLASGKGLKIEPALRLVAAVLSIAGGLVTAAVLLFLRQPDCGKISSENQMLAGFVALLAGLAMGVKELKESFSSQDSDDVNTDHTS